VTEQTKLILAQMQVENLIKLLKDNPYENYMCGKLHGVKYELMRQINIMGAEKYNVSVTVDKVATIG